MGREGWIDGGKGEVPGEEEETITFGAQVYSFCTGTSLSPPLPYLTVEMFLCRPPHL